MLDLLNLMTLIPGDFSGAFEKLKSGYLGPLFFIAIAVFALVFIKDRAWIKLVSFVGIAAIVSLFIFNSEAIFGSGGAANDVANDVVTSVNAITMQGLSLFR